MRKYKKYMAGIFLLFILLAGCSGKEDTLTFNAEIEQVSENSILVNTIEFKDFDRASVDLTEAEYDFEPEAGQLVEVTIRPEIRESYPVQVTGVKMVLKGAAERKVSDYFPLKENVKYVYEGEGNEYAGFDVYVEYRSGDKIQHRVDNGGTVIARIYEMKDGKLTRTFSKGEIYHRENLLMQRDEQEEIMLMEPLEKGTSWTLADGRQRTITGMSTEIRTSMGTYQTIEVITEGTAARRWIIMPGMSPGEDHFPVGRDGSQHDATSVEEDVDRTETIRFYYPDIDTEKSIIRKRKWLSHQRRSNRILEKAYKDIARTSGVVLSTMLRSYYDTG